ncbi:MAG TPA: DUF2269 domain-containing protein [Xanthomonadaceae bacterium]|nr:DUF2269 domain-containing protein [Xanthomonadaceae bacterium]
MEGYFWLKTAHVVSATLLFGTGLGTAYFQWMAHRRGEIAAIAVTARHVVLADWLFTTPAMIAQPLTGWLLLDRLGIAWTQSWVLASLALFVLAGACWLPVVAIQIRVRAEAEQACVTGALSPRYHRLMRTWFALGWPAFAAVLAIFWLMVRKPALW